MLLKFSLEPQHRPSALEAGAPMARARQEYSAFCETLRQRLVGGTLPPEEAYWWTQIAVEEAAR
jgi:hypothetical protein